MSIAGGYYRAVEHARDAGCDCVQLFTKNNNQWRAKSISDEDAAQFQEKLAALKITHPIAHSSYLINLASPDPALWKKSLDAFIEELKRADRLGLTHLVVHPGAFTTATEAQGIKNIARALNQAHRRTAGIKTRCLLENTAGQGSNLGWNFEQLAAMFDAMKEPERAGICFDTCHAFAAGYNMIEKEDYQATMRAVDKTVGVKKIEAFHLNDSKRELGSRVDRHEHIGQGHLGIEPFRHLLNDRRFRRVPMYLETPKGDVDGETWDQINLRTLRELIAF